MKFIVSGADRKTGRDASLAIAAASAEEAERIATKQGILVASVKPQAVQMATDVGTGSLPVWGDDPGDAQTISSPGPAAPSRAPARAASAGAGPGTARPQSAPEPTPSGIALQDASPPAPPAGAEPGATPGGRDSAIPASARYHVIQNPALYLLEMAVNKHIKEGWEPLGGIQVSYASNQLLFYQALVRKAPNESAAGNTV